MTDKIFSVTSNFDLEELAKNKFKVNINAIKSKNEFYKTKFKQGAYIINLDDSENAGTHWTCLYIINKTAVYFDSFGGSVPFDIIQFVKKRCNKILYSIDSIQNINKDSCGYYCLAFLHFIKKYKKNKNLSAILNLFNGMFDKNETEKNETILYNYIKKI